MRYDHSINKYIYLVSYFEDGIPVGKWNYYQLKQDTIFEESKDYQIIKEIKNPRKGDLIYNETYQNGKLLNIEFKK